MGLSVGIDDIALFLKGYRKRFCVVYYDLIVAQKGCRIGKADIERRCIFRGYVSVRQGLRQFLIQIIAKEKEVVEDVAPVQYAQPSSLKLEDIKDEDMMVAALVATIDYHEETKQDVRVVSIKQIG